ncbi:hypothetical protein HGRIS_006111 [Hohenbuehelia grisea]|uniref:F-box domain-containing protein n=1 Tax=Hohenbuehelia grisea TaxID=104357 RepID=A0ABR3K012_9AGAR
MPTSTPFVPFTAFPTEFWVEIIPHLDLKSLIAIRCTSRALRSLAASADIHPDRKSFLSIYLDLSDRVWFQAIRPRPLENLRPRCPCCHSRRISFDADQLSDPDDPEPFWMNWIAYFEGTVNEVQDEYTLACMSGFIYSDRPSDLLDPRDRMSADLLLWPTTPA